MSRPYQNQEPDEDPRSQQRGQPQDNEPEANPNAGGLGGILGSILGGGQAGPQTGGGPNPGGGLLSMLLGNPRILMFLVIAAGSVLMYFTKNQQEMNPITDETHRVPWAPAKDVPMGLQAAPEMIQQYGGEYQDRSKQALIDQVGAKLVKANAVGDWAPVFNQYQWDFHLLADPETINAFALPGGQIFFTYGLFKHLETEDEVAGVIGHEIGHVIARHSAQQMAKSQLISGLVMAGASAASNGGQNNAQMAQMIGGMINMKYGRADESQADKLGTQFMVNAGYNPGGIIKVMEVLKAQMGSSRQPEIMSTHPDPGNREAAIKQVIEDIKAGRIEGPKSVAEPDHGTAPQ